MTKTVTGTRTGHCGCGNWVWKERKKMLNLGMAFLEEVTLEWRLEE